MEQKIKYKKDLGQNFIYDQNLLNAVADDGDVCSNDVVLEIGAGAGTLTRILAMRAKRIVAFEIDMDLFPYLEKLNQEYKNIELHMCDFMQADLNSLGIESARVVANIPYYITTPIIFKLIESGVEFKSILMLTQKEVAERFAAKSGNKDYGITSVILQSKFDAKITRIVRKECFTPIPKVDSALCKFVPHGKYKIDDFVGFENFVSTAFSMRRKTFVNNLKNVYKKDVVVSALEKCGYASSVRSEDISVPGFVDLFNLLRQS